MRRVSAVDRALDVLEVFLAESGPLTVAEIGRRVDIPRSTLHEIVFTLADRGYLESQGDGFRLGLRAFELANADGSRLDLAAASEEEAGRLVAATGETSQVAVLDGTEVVYIAKVDGTDALRLVSEVGRRLPANCTGVGKAILSGLTAEALGALYPIDASLTVMTAHSIGTLESLQSDLALTRTRGYAFDDCESNLAVRCVATPIWDASGIVAAISVSVPTVRWTPETEPALARLVKDAGARLSRRLGGAVFTRTTA